MIHAMPMICKVESYYTCMFLLLWRKYFASIMLLCFVSWTEEDNDQMDLLERVIQFLLALAGTKQSSHKSAVGHQKHNLPSVGLTSQEVWGDQCFWSKIIITIMIRHIIIAMIMIRHNKGIFIGRKKVCITAQVGFLHYIQVQIFHMYVIN